MRFELVMNMMIVIWVWFAMDLISISLGLVYVE